MSRQTKKRILLVQVPSKTAMEGFGPYNLACLAAQVEDLAEVKIYNASTRTVHDVLQMVQSFSPDMVGLCTFLTANVPAALDIGRAVKECSPAWVVAGGHGATSMPEQMLSTGWIDTVVRGEGEATMRELAEAWSPVNILGVSYRDRDAIIHNATRPVIEDLDSLPFPSFHLLDMLEIVVHQFETSRGCPNRCAFCDASRFYGHIWRAKSPERVVEEIKLLVETYGAYAFFPADDNITADMTRLGNICELILKHNLSISVMAQARADAIVRQPEIVELMARAGFHMLVIGVESGNADTLRDMRKNATVETIEQAMSILKRFNVGVDAAVILGLPNETREMMLNTVEYAVGLEPETVGFNIFAAYPGTDLYDHCQKESLLLSDDWTRYDEYHQVVKTPDWPEVSVETIRREACKRFYNRPDWIRLNMQARPGQEVKTMFSKGAWVTFSQTFDFNDLDTWNQALRGFSAIVNAELEQRLPAYSAVIRLKTDNDTFFLPIQTGRLNPLLDSSPAWDLTLETDRKTLEEMLIQMTLDGLSAFVLGRVRTGDSVAQVLDFVHWVNALQIALDLHMGGAAFERPACLEALNAAISNTPDLAAKLDNVRLTARLQTSAGDLLLKLVSGKVADLQMVQPGQRLRKIDATITLDDELTRAILLGGTLWNLVWEQLCHEAQTRPA